MWAGERMWPGEFEPCTGEAWLNGRFSVGILRRLTIFTVGVMMRRNGFAAGTLGAAGFFTSLPMSGFVSALFVSDTSALFILCKTFFVSTDSLDWTASVVESCCDDTSTTSSNSSDSSAFNELDAVSSRLWADCGRLDFNIAVGFTRGRRVAISITEFPFTLETHAPD